MIKKFLLICISLTSLQGVISQRNIFGGFFGGCPEFKPGAQMSFEEINGKWYTHWLSTAYSPMKYTRCHSHVLNLSPTIHGSTITTNFRYLSPLISFQLHGEVRPLESSNGGEINFQYDGWFGGVPQRAVLLQSYPEDTALVWTCSDYEFFHVESIQLITKFKDPTKLSQGVLDKVESFLKGAGVPPESFVVIDQTCEI